MSRHPFWLPGRDHEGRQESLGHSHGESERVLSYDYEIYQWENYNGVDCKSVNKREKQVNRWYHLLVLTFFQTAFLFITSFNFNTDPIRKWEAGQEHMSPFHIWRYRDSVSRWSTLSKLDAKPVAEPTFQSSQNSHIMLPSPVHTIPADCAQMLSLPSATET